MKREVFKEDERVFFTCPLCGTKYTPSANGVQAYEKKIWKCSACKETFSFYINQIGKVFTEAEGQLKYIGYIYKVL